MIRDSIEGNYWDYRIQKDLEWISKSKELLENSSCNPAYDPQFSFDLSRDYLRLILRRYSRGDAICELVQHFSGVIESWELSNNLADEVCRKNNLKTCRDWVFDLENLNHYNWCFWLLGLGLALEIPDDLWLRLLILIGSEGQDVLLDRVIANRQNNRQIGTRLLHKKPYARLLKAIDAPENEQAFLLKEFVDNWYAELARKGKDELWWYIYGDPEKHPLEKGSYFGRWCIEAVAAAKSFDMDDTLCMGHEHYPGDLLRPTGPSSHLKRTNSLKFGFLSRLFGKDK